MNLSWYLFLKQGKQGEILLRHSTQTVFCCSFCAEETLIIACQWAVDRKETTVFYNHPWDEATLHTNVIENYQDLYIKFDCIRCKIFVQRTTFTDSCNLMAFLQKAFWNKKTLITITAYTICSIQYTKFNWARIYWFNEFKIFFSECGCNQGRVIRSGKTVCKLVWSSLQVLH